VVTVSKMSPRLGSTPGDSGRPQGTSQTMASDDDATLYPRKPHAISRLELTARSGSTPAASTHLCLVHAGAQKVPPAFVAVPLPAYA